MLERFLLGFHLLDFAADACDLLFDGKNIRDFAGALLKDCLEAALRFPGILQAGHEVGVLLGDFLSALSFVLDLAQGFEFG
jgi:hypothetical protein